MPRLLSLLAVAILSTVFASSAAACTTTVSTIAAASSAVTAAAAGDTVCLANGTYGALSLSQAKSSPGVTVTAASPGNVTVGSVSLSGSWVTVSQMTMGSVSLPGDNVGVTDSNIGAGVSIVGSSSNYATGNFLKRDLITHPGGSGEKDTIQAQWASGLVVEDNKLVLADENGTDHNDGFQAFWSLRGARFYRNWFTGGLGAQGFFLKDFGSGGDCTNVEFSDNLIADRADNGINSAGSPFQFNQCNPNATDPLSLGYGMRAVHNTVYANPNGSYLRSETGAPSGVYLHLNVLDDWDKGGEVSTATVNAVDDDYNLIQGGSIGRNGTHDVDGPPVFRDRSNGDYRLTASSEGDFGANGVAGVDWKVGDIAYGPSPVFVSDSFTGSSAVVTSHTGELGASWTAHPASTGSTFLSSSGGVRETTTSSTGVYYASGVPATADYKVEADFLTRANWASDFTAYAHVLARVDTSATTFYACRYSKATTAVELVEWNAGTATVDASTSKTLAASTSYHVVFSLVGSSLSCTIGGTTAAASDSSITAAGRAGIRLINNPQSVSDGIHIDNVVASSL